MERSPLSTESLAILIDFVIAHDSSIIQKLSNPIKLDVSRYIYIGNNALEFIGKIFWAFPFILERIYLKIITANKDKTFVK